MSNEFINYGLLVDEAMHLIVKKSLEVLSDNTLQGDHHFYISFLTTYPGVTLSDKLKSKYPQEMTIVLQYQFENLHVYQDSFEVTLSFDNIKERIVIPFKALTAFADPSVKFGLQFKHFDDEYMLEDESEMLEDEEEDFDPIIHKRDNPIIDVQDNVISIDNFRKKK